MSPRFALPVLLAAAFAVFSVSTAQAQYPTPTFPDITFATYSTTPGARDCKLDVHIPTVGTAPYPVLIYVHGGGWSTGGRKTPHDVWINALAQGIAVVTIEYRLTSQPRQFGTIEGTQTGTYIPVTWPAQIHDCKAAVRWVRGNAAVYGFDIDRIALFGTSAGGHLVAAMGTMGGVASYSRNGQAIDMEGTVGNYDNLSSRVFALCDFFGPTDILNMQLDVVLAGSLNHDSKNSFESNLIGSTALGLGIGDIRANVDSPVVPYPFLSATTISANPITFSRPDMPLMFIAHGDNDTSVPVNQSVRLNAAQLASGSSSKLTIVPHAGHGVLGTETNNAATAWIVGVLKGTLVCPSITTQPLGQTTCRGGSVSLTVAAAGTGPLTYQWRRNGVNLSGPIGTGAALALSNAKLSDAGSYDCTVTNGCGSVRSAAAALSVCGADFSCDGFVTGEDFDAFVSDFATGGTRADFNADGFVTGEDFDGFVAAFEAGC